MKDILTRFFTLLLVPLATAHAAEDATTQSSIRLCPRHRKLACIAMAVAELAQT